MGTRMKTKVILLNGQLINVGDWDYCIMERDVIDVDGVVTLRGDWDYKPDADGEPTNPIPPHAIQRVDCKITNPLPEGAVEAYEEIVVTAKGRITLKSDYRTQRADAYPAITEQLDALWKGGEAAEAMAEAIAQIKRDIPKPR